MPGVDRLHSFERAGTTYYYLTDHLGTVIGVADGQGNLKNVYRYDPWGWRESAAEGVANAYGFAGREYDAATGFYYLRARYYDTWTGRFLSEDPLGVAGGINQYAYAGGNPIAVRDPTGLDREKDEPCEDDPYSEECEQQRSEEVRAAEITYRSLIITMGWEFANAWLASWVASRVTNINPRGYVLNNPLVQENVRSLRAAIAKILGHYNFAFFITGGDRYEVYLTTGSGLGVMLFHMSATPGQGPVWNSAFTSAHLISRGARAVDVRIVGASRAVILRAVGMTDFLSTPRFYGGHVHFRLPNLPQYYYRP
jgi:RHS repeat-associated protein